MTLYTDEIRNYIRSRSWPPALSWEVVEYELGYLGFRMFRQNFDALDGEDKLHTAMMVKEVMEKVRADGIPIYMEVSEGNGKSV